VNAEVALGRPLANRILVLDGLRGIAVLLVIFAHARQTIGFPILPFSAASVFAGNLGSIGVDIFFVLSGFLITNLLCRERALSSHISIRQFYLRRVLRIMPAYVVFLSTIWMLTELHLASVSRRDWIAALTYTMNFRDRPSWIVGHLWSLSIEEHYYLIWPIVFSLLSPRRAVAILALVLVTCPAIRWGILIWKPSLSAMTDLWTFTRLDCIAAGCLAALLIQREASMPFLRRLCRLWTGALAIVVIAVILSSLSGKFAVGVAPSLIAICLGVLILVSIQSSGTLLENRYLRFIGTVSYSLYLWQQVFLNPHEDHLWTRFPGNLLLAVTAALGSYFIVERTFFRLKNALEVRRISLRAPTLKVA